MDLPKDNPYLLDSSLIDGQLMINLNILDPQKGQKIIKCFHISHSDDTLPIQIKKNFQDVTNVHSILTQSPEACKVNTQAGILTLVYSVTFPNGKKFQLEGVIKLQEKQIPIQKQETKDDGMGEKIQKLQNQIKKIQEIYQNDSKQTKQMMAKLSKDMINDLQQLKQRYEQMKNWKKQQQIRYKYLQNQVKSNKNNNPQIKGIPDELMHVFDKKLQEQKQFFTDKLQNQAEKIQFMKDSLTRHQKLIDKLAQENIDLKKNLKQMEQKTNVMENKNDLYETKLVQFKQIMDKTIKTVISQQQQHEKIKSQIKNSPKKQPQPQHQSQQQQPTDPLIAFFQNISSPPPQMNFVQSPKSQQQSQKQKTFINQMMQIDQTCGYCTQFINNGKLISYNGINNQSTQLIGKYKINTHKISYITIGKSKQNQIGFGIMDIKYISQRNSIKNANCIMYYGWNGGVYEGGQQASTDGTGFRPGDKVKMRVNLVEGVVEWSIGGIVTSKHRSQKLTDGRIEWVPFIRMCDRGDCLKWSLD